MKSKEKLYISLAGKKLVIKSMNMFLGFGMKTTKDYHLYLKWDVLLLANAFENLEIKV